MRLVTFIYKDKEKIGLLSLDEKSVIPIEDVKPELANLDMIAFIKAFKAEDLELFSKSAINGKGIDVSEVKIQAPIPEPTRVICIGKNYREHIKELATTEAEKSYVPEMPIYFSKLVD